MLRFKRFLNEKSLSRADIIKPSKQNPSRKRAQDIYDKITKGEPIQTSKDSDFNGQAVEIEFIDSEIENAFREGDADSIPPGRKPYFQLKSNPNIELKLSDIEKTKEFGSSSGSGGGARSTARQETIHALFYSYIFNVRGSEFGMDDFETGDLEKAFKYLKVDGQSLEKILAYPEYLDEEWLQSIIASTNAFYKWFRANRNASGPFFFHRDSSLMNNLYKKFRDLQKKQGLRLANDKWNPGDIWMANSHGEGILSEKFNTLSEYNRLVGQYYMSGDLMGISLKRIGQSASVKEYNTENAQKSKVEFRNASLHGPRNNLSFFNNVKLYVYTADRRRIEFRAFDGDSSFQAQLMGDAAAGGKIGHGPINDVLKMVGVEELPEGRQVTRKARKPDDRFLRDFYSLFTRYAQGDERQMDEDEFITHVKSFDEDFRAKFLFSKYLSTYMADIFARNRDKRDEILDGMFSYAASATKFSSPFVKVS